MQWKAILTPATIVLAASLPCLPAKAQSVDTMVVFDGSNSMWGQIDGRAKIEIARETLSSVLSETKRDMQIGLIAYGHRERGMCSDIETLVPVSPASQSIPRIITATDRITPRGKTPLSNAVRMAAEELRYTENAATVVLVTDGIETCNADPCALASELESAGIDFTAHVIGFGLSAEESRQVQCLADNTGGLYLRADDAGALKNALNQTVNAEITPSDENFEPENAGLRDVHFIFRDTPGGEILGARNLEVRIEKDTGETLPEEASFSLNYPETKRRSAEAKLEPGQYQVLIRRLNQGRGSYQIRYSFDVPAGDETHLIEASLSAGLIINAFLNPQTPLDTTNPPLGGVKNDKAWAYFSVFPVTDGEIAETPIVKEAWSDLEIALPAGTYLIRGNIDRFVTAEQIVQVEPGEPTEVDFSFDVTRVFIDARDETGFPVEKQTVYWYETLPDGRNWWRGGRGSGKGQPIPFYAPTGTWHVDAGGEGAGERRSQFVVKVPGTYEDIRLQIGAGERLTDAEKAIFTSPDYKGCEEIIAVKYDGCLVKKAVLPGSVATTDPEDSSGSKNMNQEQSSQPAPSPATDLSEEGESGSPPSDRHAASTEALDDRSSNFLEGLSGTDYVFVDSELTPLAHVVLPNNGSGRAGRVATLVMRRGITISLETFRLC
ncbi:VWA domain-containing protein [Fulvimarina sp. MAC8]|uniref:vWA domain-containing protein n=1 Tax=Fulvimarina sp. MAC8 TaxID=3162874 RepID=UPI0032EE9365